MFLTSISILYMVFINLVFGINNLYINGLPKILRIIKYLFDCIISINIVSILIYTIFKYIDDKNIKYKLYF